MKLIINGETKVVPDDLTISGLLEYEKVQSTQYVSVQLNEEFVRTETFVDTRLSEGDRIDFMYFMGGGSVTGRWKH